MCDQYLSVLSPESWPFSLEWLPVPTYMVGGAVRDALLERRREYLDLDFVMPEKAVKTARAIAHHYKAGFVLLDRERQIARVVFKNATADFAQQEGDTLETDLHRRDFTVNAIAYNPHTQELIDPLQGYADLQQGIIRMVSPANLKDDPLRLLRGYRQAAQLGFAIASETRVTIRQLAPLLAEIAAERVRVEFSYLLGNPQGSDWLTIAYEDGLLSVWFPHVTAQKLKLIAAIDRWVVTLAAKWPQIGTILQESISDTLKSSWLSLAKLSCLVASETQQAEAELINLKYSRTEIRTVTTAVKLLPGLASLGAGGMSLREQYFFFQEAGEAFPVVAVFAVAVGVNMEAIAPLIDRYLTPDDQVAHPTQLVTGNDLIQALNLRPSPKIGQLLTEIQLSRIEGKISTPAEAIKFASQLLDTW